MPKLPSGFSISEQERVLERRKNELKSLTRERDRLRHQLNAVENKIRGLGGRSTPALGVTRGARARNAGSLVDTLTQVMGKAGGPMKVGDIVQAVLDSGYHSNAANVRGLVNQTLIKERKRFANAARGTYELKK